MNYTEIKALSQEFIKAIRSETEAEIRYLHGTKLEDMEGEKICTIRNTTNRIIRVIEKQAETHNPRK